MKKILILFLTIILSFSLKAQDIINGTNLFDFGWRFHKGGSLGAESPSFKDSLWRIVDLPHDWSIEDLPGTNSPFSPDAISQVNGGYTTGGTGWYRKNFVIPTGQSKKRILIQFDGIYMNADVYINGRNVGNHPYGYTSFWYDVTERIKFGQDNIIAVKVRNEGENSRWYSGSGIYRHVWLKVLDPVYVENWGVSITTPEVTSASARVNISTIVNNKSDSTLKVNLVSQILSPKGIEIVKSGSEQTIEKAGSYEFKQDLTLPKPDLWSPENPSFYIAVNEVYSGGKLVDRVETKFGVRTLTFDVTNGFQLNGKTVKLKGGCFHDDNGPLGSRSYDRAEERRVELLKANGFNAVRCSHNPPAPAFLDACDRLGILVIDEAFDMWLDGKNRDDYHLYFDKWCQKDIESIIMRDRNHPSIILWSIGNEIPGMQNPEVVKTAERLVGYVRKADPTRLVTSAVNGISPNKDPFFATLDIGGYNYGSNRRGTYDIDHLRVPARIMVQTESDALNAFDSWMDVLDHPYLIGDFIWTALDYIGEASIGWRGYPQGAFYPWNLAFCGDIDLCGWKRPQSFYRDALWKSNQLSIFVKPPKPSFGENIKRNNQWGWYDLLSDWNWKGYEDTLMKVNVYSSCETVELFLNKKSLGIKKTDRSTKFIAEWDVPYQAGELKAIGYNGKKSVNTTLLNTTGEPAQIKITADRTELKANGQDLSYITVEFVDSRGIQNPKAENLVKFDIEGPCTIVGVGNANPVSLESYQQSQRKAWKGRCVVIVKADKKEGIITLKASAEGLAPASIQINSR